MRPIQAAGQRRRQVRRAARSWHRAKWIDAAKLAEIERFHADDRRRQGAALRVLFGVLAAFALSSGFLLLRMLSGTPAFSASWFFFEAVVYVALTELQFGLLRLDGFGTETATAFMGYVCFVAASGSLLVNGWGGFERFGWLAALAALAGLAGAWRWGSVTLATAGTIAGFVALTQLPWARAAWILVGALVAAACWRARRDPRPAPAHRLAAAFVFCLAVAALIVAFHPSSNEERFLEALRVGHANSESPVLPPLLAWLAMFLFSGGLCALGIRRRDRVVLGAGLAAVAVFLVSAAIELRPQPLWFLLTAAGGLLVASTMAIGRWLERGPQGERGGWTTDPLAEGMAAAPIESVAALATAAATASSTPVESSPVPLRGDDGEFGGGGATGSY